MQKERAKTEADLVHAAVGHIKGNLERTSRKTNEGEKEELSQEKMKLEYGTSQPISFKSREGVGGLGRLDIDR